MEFADPPDAEISFREPIEEGANVEILRSLILQAVLQQMLGKQTAVELIRWLDSL